MKGIFAFFCLFIAPLSPSPNAVTGDGAAVELVVAGGEVGRVDDQHLPGRTGQGELRAVTSL